MKDRFLKVSIFLLVILLPASFSVAATKSPFEHELIGQCFSAFADARKPFLLPDGTEDENVGLTNAEFDKKSTWVVDKTTSHNFQWYLIESSVNGYCYVLYVPFAAEVAGTRNNGILTIQAQTQPSPGTKSYQMMFRKSKKSSRFVPYRCTEMQDQTPTKLKPRSVDCRSVSNE
jgi:hypothetical protein